MYCLVNIPSFILNENYINYRPLKDLGENTGNCLFWESTKNILRQQNLNLLSIQDFRKNPEQYQQNITKVVFANANFIGNYNPGYSETYDIEKLKWIIKEHLGILSRLSCKKYLISVGAQSNDLEFFKFKENQKKDYINYFSLFDTIYLRGKYTYELLEYNQIPTSNMTILGCPSLLLKPINLDELKSKFDKIKQLKVSKIKIGISIGGIVRRNDIQNMFIDLMADKTFRTLVQSGQQWVNFIQRKSTYPPLESYRTIDTLRQKYLKWKISKNVNNFKYDDNYLNLIKYFSENVNCMITTRIHGTVLGLLSGLPSLCLVTDSRTYELCEQMGIPYFNCINQPIKWKNKKELVNIFLENCIFSEKLNQTVIDMNEKYKVFENSQY